MAVLMAKRGYVAVPMTVTDKFAVFTIPCRIGDESFRMIVDTGSESTRIDEAIIIRLKLSLGPEHKSLGIGGMAIGHEVVLPDGMQIGPLHTREICVGKLTVQTSDLSQMNDLLKTNKQPPIGGILGLNTFRHCSAVIDASSKTLYLQTPLDNVWPEIEGRWVAVRREQRGEATVIDSPDPVRIEFKNRQITIVDRGVGANVTYCVHALPGPDPMVLMMYKPGDELKGATPYSYIGVMKFTPDKLTLGLGVDRERTGEDIPALRTGPGGVVVLLECVRDKP